MPGGIPFGTPVDLELDRQPGRAHLLGERLDAPERRLRRPRLLLVVVPQHPEQPAHLTEGLLARALDRVERGTGGRGIAGEHLAPTAGLDDDDRDRVRDDVVELPRDPRPLLGHGCSCALVLIALELDRAERERALALAVAAGSPTRQPTGRR